MPQFPFDDAEILTFFAVLVRYSVLFALLPFVGDRVIPAPLKILFSVAATIVLFPALVKSGMVVPAEAEGWSATAGGMARTVGLEALFAAVLGFTARFAFDSILFGANLIGTFMGFSTATQFDPHHETQSQVVGEFYVALAMLVFLALDGHHLMLKTAMESYQWVGMGKVNLAQGAFSQQILALSALVLRYGLQLAAPVGIAIFTVNIAFGVLSKAMPQLNVLVLSFAVTSLVGLAVMLMSIADFQGVLGSVFEKMSVWMAELSRTLGNG